MWAGEPPWGSGKGGMSPTDTRIRTKLLPTRSLDTAVRASPHAPHQPHGGRSVSSLTTAFRKPPLATSPCGSGAAWALPKSIWWGGGPSENCGQPSLPAPQPPSLLRCPGSSSTGTWPSTCRGGWCPELRPAHCPVHPHGLPCSFLWGPSGRGALGQGLRVSADGCPSELLGLREARPSLSVLRS